MADEPNPGASADSAPTAVASAGSLSLKGPPKVVSLKRRGLFMTFVLFGCVGICIACLWRFDSAPPKDAHLLRQAVAARTEDDPSSSVSTSVFDKLPSAGLFGIDSLQWSVQGFGVELGSGKAALAERLRSFADSGGLKSERYDEVVVALKEVFKLPGERSARITMAILRKRQFIVALLRWKLLLAVAQDDTGRVLEILSSGSQLATLELSACGSLVEHWLQLSHWDSLVQGLDGFVSITEMTSTQLQRVQELLATRDLLHEARQPAIIGTYTRLRRWIQSTDEIELAKHRGWTKKNRALGLLMWQCDRYLALPLDNHEEYLTRQRGLAPSSVAVWLGKYTGNGGGYALARRLSQELADHDRKLFVSRARDLNMRVSLALLRYERKEGGLPATLDELTPAYLPYLPRDVYDGAPLRYVPAERRVYSIGSKSGMQGNRIMTLFSPGLSQVVPTSP